MFKIVTMIACGLGLILGCEIEYWETLKDKAYQENEKYILISLEDSQENCKVICENVPECKGFRYSQDKCELNSQDHSNLKEEIGSAVVVQKCFKYDLDQLKKDAAALQNITDVRLKKDAMEQNLQNFERTLKYFKNNRDTFKFNPRRNIHIDYDSSSSQWIESKTPIILAIVFMVVVVISNVTAVFHEKYQKCQKRLFGLLTCFLCATLLAVFITFGQIDAETTGLKEITVKPHRSQIDRQKSSIDIRLFDTKLVGKDQWFYIKYADIHGGDSNSRQITKMEEILGIIKYKPKRYHIAYQYVRQVFYIKPANQWDKGIWSTADFRMKDGSNPYHLFLYGKNLGFKRGGKTLFMLPKVDFHGSNADGKVFQKGKVNNCGEAHSLIMQMKNEPLNSAYYWSTNSKALIEKPPNKRKGKWATNSGCLFIWADQVLDNLPDAKCPPIFNISNFDEKQFQMVKEGKVDINDGVYSFQQNSFLGFKGPCVNRLPDYDFKIELKFKTKVADCGIFSFDSSGHDRHSFLKGGKPHHRIWKGAKWGVNNIPNLNDNEWHHWVLTVKTFEGQTMFIDGKKVGTNPYDHSDFDWKTGFYLGYSSDAGKAKSKFSGQIKDLIITELSE